MPTNEKAVEKFCFVLIQVVMLGDGDLFNPLDTYYAGHCVVRAPILEEAAKKIGFEIDVIISQGNIKPGGEKVTTRASVKSEELRINGEFHLVYIHEAKDKARLITVDLPI